MRSEFDVESNVLSLSKWSPFFSFIVYNTENNLLSKPIPLKPQSNHWLHQKNLSQFKSEYFFL